MGHRRYAFRATVTFYDRIPEAWLRLIPGCPSNGLTLREVWSRIFRGGYTVREFFRACVAGGTPLDIKITIIDEKTGKAIDVATGEEVIP